MKINKHLFIFSSLLILLLASYFFVLVKFFPILLHHTFYYCREMAKNISLNLPGNWGIVVFGILSVSILYTVFKLFLTVVQVYKFRQMLYKSILKNHRLFGVFTSLKLTGKVVVLQETKPFAYCFGVRNPKIFISTGLISMINKQELKVILRHEQYHLENRDNLILLLATFVESLFPFFPILTDLIRIYKTDRELLADQAAIQSVSDKHTLSSILKKLLQYEPLTLPRPAPAIADFDTLDTRIKSLLSVKVNYRKLRKRNVLYSMIFVTVLGGFIGAPVHAAEFHRNGLDAMIVCNETASCESACKGNNSVNLQSVQSSYPPLQFSSQN